MSFTAQVKDELSRIEGTCGECAYAQLSAITRVCGTLSFRGTGRYSIRVATETGAVARTMIKLTHELFDLETPLTVRHSNLHKTRNYLIEIPEQDELERDLVRLGILVPGQGLAPGVPEKLVARDCCKRAFVRGAFMAGGFIADPRGDFHLEIAVSGEGLAQGIVALFSELGISARLNRRRGAYAIYIKSFDDIVRLLRAMGARRSALAVENVRRVKSLKNEVNRRVNAELANQARSTGAAADQMQLIAQAERLIGLRALPPALREFCLLRRANPDVSLATLGERCAPPASKSAMYHRVLRLQHLVEEKISSTTDSDSVG
jgi:DNA-binding protein WhiA